MANYPIKIDKWIKILPNIKRNCVTEISRLSRTEYHYTSTLLWELRKHGLVTKTGIGNKSICTLTKEGEKAAKACKLFLEDFKEFL